MLTIAIDCGDQLHKGRAALAGDLLQTVPELVFKADAGLVACNDNRALRNQRLHGFSPANEPSVLTPGRCIAWTSRPVGWPGYLPIKGNWDGRPLTRHPPAKHTEHQRPQQQTLL